MPASRRRKSAIATPAAPSKAAAPPAAAAPPPTPIAHAKRLAILTVVVAAPYFGWVGYMYAHLQSGLLRKPISVTTTRQLLIVGTQSSGTTDMTSTLQALGLEIAHEASDAAWNFCRDGSISWLHLLRFMPGIAPTSTTTDMCLVSRRNSERAIFFNSNSKFPAIMIWLRTGRWLVVYLLSLSLSLSLSLARLPVRSGIPPGHVPRATSRLLVPAGVGRVLAT